MALPILDGNQTAATLSTIITGGAHIPAHTVVSLGSQAISDITSGVSGSVVSISNFPSTQTVAGTVTANNLPLVGDNFSSTTLGAVRSALYIKDTVGGSGFVGIGNDADEGLPVRVNGTALPISGTVTANVSSIQQDDNGGGEFMPVGFAQVDGPNGALDLWLNVNQYRGLPIKNQISSNDLFPEALLVSGTVTANMFGFDCVNNEYSPIPVLPYNEPIDCGNTVIARLTDTSGTDLNLANGVPISGTVTANNPSGALTTRFGSVTTANTAQITSAVTNTSRKYLLAQNISAGTVTIGIGFSPTTTQGIQLAAGGGLTFDAFCPTGAVYWLGAVTGAAFTILEG